MGSNNGCSFGGGTLTAAAGACGSCRVPGYWPAVLTEWSTAAMRTRPADLLWWSVVYFDMKSRRENPPVKPYLDVPGAVPGPGGLTASGLKALAATLRRDEPPRESPVPVATLWAVLSLDEAVLARIMRIGRFGGSIEPTEFVGIAAAHLTDRLRDTMILLCDALSAEDGSAGVPLDDFARVYRYLARLNCADADPSDERSASRLGENIPESGSADSRCFGRAGSPSSDGCFSRGTVSSKTVAEVFDVSRSDEGVMAWHRDDADGPLPETGSERTIEPRINVTVCDDPEFLLSLKKLRENSEYVDVLSLISGSSIISEPISNRSAVEPFVDSKLYDEMATVEGGPGGEEMQFVDYENSFLESKDSSDGREDANARNYELVINNEYDEHIFVGDETGDMVEYENDSKSDLDVEINEDDSRKADVKVNTDFIVMLALVSDVNNPLLTAVSDESSESEFSLLEKTTLNDTAVEGNDKTETDGQKFEDNYQTKDVAESADSESDGSSNKLQNSKIDQISVRSTASEKSSVHAERMSASDAVSGNNLAREFGTDQWLDGEEPYRLGLGEFDEEAEQNDNGIMCDEGGERYQLSRNFTAEESVVNTDSWDSVEEVHVLPGVGPAVPEDQIQRVIDWVTKCAENQNNFVRGHNLLHFLCPPLDRKPSGTNDGQEFTFDE